MQVKEFLGLSADRFPDTLALVVGGQKLTYRNLHEQANALAHSLMKLGVRRGDRVAICLDHSVESVVPLV